MASFPARDVYGATRKRLSRGPDIGGGSYGYGLFPPEGAKGPISIPLVIPVSGYLNPSQNFSDGAFVTLSAEAVKGHGYDIGVRVV